jgi:hypothetical protein
MGDYAIILYCDHLAHKGMRLDFASITYSDVLLNFYEGTDKTVVSYFAAIEINGLNNGDVMSKIDITDLDVYKCRLVHG